MLKRYNAFKHIYYNLFIIPKHIVSTSSIKEKIDIGIFSSTKTTRISIVGSGKRTPRTKVTNTPDFKPSLI